MVVETLSGKDLRIIQELRENARTKFTSIASTTGIPKSTVFDKIKQFEVGVIRKYAAVLDFTKLGFNCRFLFFVQVNISDRNELREILRSHPCVNNMYVLANGFDFLFECVFRNKQEANRFKSELKQAFPKLNTMQYEVIVDLEREKFGNFL